MKPQIGLFIFILIASAFCLAACRKPGKETDPGISQKPTDQVQTSETEEPAEEKSAVTLMIYMTGSDLESSSAAATKDMEEMLSSGLDLSNVNVVVFTGGSETWFSEISPEENTLLRMTPDGFVTEERFELMSMGNPANLTRFLNYAEEHYPAEQYDLILWNHGNGPLIGYGKDRLHENDSMTLLELGEALKDSPFGPENKLGFIGFDACLMASAELVAVTGDYAEYLVSSQETEPNFGWNYSCLDGLGTLRTLDFTRQIVEKYLSYCEDYFEGKEFFQSDVTLSVIDLSAASGLKDALNDLFREAAADVSGDYNKLAVSRIKARALGRASTGSEYDLVDLRSLMESMSERYPEKTKAVLDLLGSAVMVSGANAPECCGLSIYYPYYNKAYYNRSWRETYRDLSVFPDYLTYLERYEQIWLGTDLKELFEGQLVPQNGDDPHSYMLQLTEEQAEAYAQGQYFILRRIDSGLYSMIYVSDDVEKDGDVLSARFDGKIIYYENDTGRRGIPLTQCEYTVQNSTEYTVLKASLSRDLLKESHEFQPIRYQLSLDHETDQVTVKNLYKYLSEEDIDIASGKKEEVQLSEWDVFYFPETEIRYLTRNDSGSIKSFWNWPDSGSIFRPTYELAVSDGLHFTYEPLYDDGYEYFLMFDLENVQGEHFGSELIPITMEEEPEDHAYDEEFTWQNEAILTLAKGKGISAELRFFHDSETGSMMCGVHITNQNLFEIYCSLNDFVFDETVLGAIPLQFSIKPGEEVFKWIPDFETICRLRGEDLPKTLSFEIEIQGLINGEVLIREHPVKVVFSENSREMLSRLPSESLALGSFDLPDLTRTKVEPYHGALAGEQVLADNERFGIKLLSLGMDPYGSNNLMVFFEVQNRSQENIYFGFRGIQKNGVFDYSHSNSDGVVPAGLQKYMLVYISESLYYRDYRDSATHEPPYTGGLQNISLLICAFPGKLETVGTWYPVVLTEAARESSEPERGFPIFDDAGVRVELRGVKEAFSSLSAQKKEYTWLLTVLNDTDQRIEIQMEDRKVNGETLDNHTMRFAGWNEFGPKSLSYSRIVLDECTEREIPIISFTLQIEFHGRSEMFYQSDKPVEIKPEMIPEKEPEALQWRGESSVVLWEGSGVLAEMLFFRNSKSGRMLAAISVTNRNEFGIVYTVPDIVIDDKALLNQAGCISMEIAPGEQSMEWILYLPSILSYRKESFPAAISLIQNAVNPETTGKLIQKERIRVDFSFGSEADLAKLPEHEPQRLWADQVELDTEKLLDPVFGACAGEQILADTEKVGIRLLGLGKTTYNNLLSIFLEIENRTEGLIPANVVGISVNGIFVKFTSRSQTIPAGKSRYFWEAVDIDYSIIPAVPDFSEIHDISLLIVTDLDEVTGSGFAGGTWYPVKLDKASDGEAEPELGQMVFDEEGIRIGFLRNEEYNYNSDGSQVSYRWWIAIDNETDQHIHLTIENVCVDGKPVDRSVFYSEPSLYDSDVGSHTIRYAEITSVIYNEKPRPESLSFTVKTVPFGSSYGTPLYTSETVVELKP